MAVCERGYLCDVCGLEVEELHESDLYLRYVLGEVDPETLHMQPERHLRCNPTLAQFIVADDFAPVQAAGLFAKAGLDPAFVAAEEARVTRGYLRLRALPGLDLRLTEYPLPEVRARWQDPAPAPGEVDAARAPASGGTVPGTGLLPPRTSGPRIEHDDTQ
jgi:hypothetical protein